MWRSEDNFWELVLSLDCVGSGNWMQASGLAVNASLNEHLSLGSLFIPYIYIVRNIGFLLAAFMSIYAFILCE